MRFFEILWVFFFLKVSEFVYFLQTNEILRKLTASILLALGLAVGFFIIGWIVGLIFPEFISASFVGIGWLEARFATGFLLVCGAAFLLSASYIVSSIFGALFSLVKNNWNKARDIVQKRHNLHIHIKE